MALEESGPVQENRFLRGLRCRRSVRTLLKPLVSTVMALPPNFLSKSFFTIITI